MCVCVCEVQCVSAQHQAPGRAWISFRKVSKVYTLFALISMFIRQRKIAGRDHREKEGCVFLCLCVCVVVVVGGFILRTSSQGN